MYVHNKTETCVCVENVSVEQGLNASLAINANDDNGGVNNSEEEENKMQQIVNSSEDEISAEDLQLEENLCNDYRLRFTFAFFTISAWILNGLKWSKSCSDFDIQLFSGNSACEWWYIWLFQTCTYFISWFILIFILFYNPSYVRILKFEKLLFPSFVYILLFLIEFFNAFFNNSYYFVQMINDFFAYVVMFVFVLYIGPFAKHNGPRGNFTVIIVVAHFLMLCAFIWRNIFEDSEEAENATNISCAFLQIIIETALLILWFRELAVHCKCQCCTMSMKRNYIIQ